MMSRGQGDTNACQRGQKAEAREAMEGSSQARQPWPQWARRRKSLDAQGLPEQHDGSRHGRRSRDRRQKFELYYDV